MGLGAAIGAVGSIAGAAISSSAAGNAADTAAAASAANNALQQQIYNSNKAGSQPFVNRGNAAGDQINALLGLAPATAGTPGTQDWNSYLTANPDVAAAYNSTPAVQQQFGSPDAYAQWHYQNYGQNEGRAAPAVTGGTAGQSSTAQQNAAFDNFKNSTGYQFAYDQGQNAVNNNYALRGALDSGASQKALVNYGQGMALNNAFLPYMQLLQGQQQTGLGAQNALAGVGTQYANAVGSNNNNAASAAGNAAIASGNAWSGALNGVGNALGQMTGSSYGNANSLASSGNAAQSFANQLWQNPTLPGYGLPGYSMN